MIEKFKDFAPQIEKSAFIHKASTIIGRVKIGENCSVWPGAVLRGDVAEINIAKNCSVQDNAVIHVDLNVDAVIGEGVTIGHNVTIHGSKIGHHCLIGMAACVMECTIGEESLVAAGTVITGGKTFAPRSLIMGVPGKVVRQLTDEEVQKLYTSERTYCLLSESYKNGEIK